MKTTASKDWHECACGCGKKIKQGDKIEIRRPSTFYLLGHGRQMVQREPREVREDR